MGEISYFVSFAEGESVRRWDPHDANDVPLADCGYLGAVFRAFEGAWKGDALTVYVTQNPRWLPEVGDHVLAVLLNDEWFRAPAYSGTVLAVLRHLARDPWFPWTSLTRPSRATLLAALNHVRLLAERWRYQRRSAAFAADRGWRPLTTDNAIDIPLGYYMQPDRPIRPWGERRTDVYFGGSLIHDLDRRARWKRVVKQALGNPKRLYRRRMLRYVQRARRAHPDLRATLTLSGDFRALRRDEVETYAEDMMDARFALVPRGTAAESYRLFEAWRYGTIPICERLPPRPFYRGAPLVELRDWRELPTALGDLLAAPERQRDLHERGLAWWRDVCSGEAVGKRLAELLSTRNAATSLRTEQGALSR